MKKNSIVVCMSLFAVLFSSNQAQAEDARYFQVKLDSDAKNKDKEIYLLVKGENPNKKDSAHLNRFCFIKFDKEGKGTCTDVDQSTDSKDFAIEYNKLPNQTMQLPYLQGGRIYISIGKPVQLDIVGYWYDSENQKHDCLQDVRPSEAAHRCAIADPSLFNPADSNYNTAYDKVEFTFENTLQGRTVINPTAVDFVSLPISITQNGKTFGFDNTSHSSLVSTIQDTFSHEKNSASWNNLIVKNENGGGVLRILSPNVDFDGIFFQANYLNSYINSLWETYKKDTLQVDCRELANDAEYKDLKTDSIFTGQVDKSGNFIFRNKGGTHTVAFKRSDVHSRDFFMAAGDAFNPDGSNLVKGVIVKYLTAAWSVGLLPETVKGTVLDKNFFDSHHGDFYKNHSDSYHVYAKAIHAVSPYAYGFPYDDVLGLDGTNQIEDGYRYPATLTLGDVSDME